MTGLELPAILGIAGSGLTAVGAISAGAAQKKASDYSSAVGMANARGARRDAAENARRQRRLNRKNVSAIRNKSSVSLDVLEDNVREAELMALDVLHKGEVQAIGLESGARLDKMRGKAAQRAGYFSAAGSLLKGAGAAYAAGGFGGATNTTGYDDTGQTLAPGAYGY